MNDNHTKKQAWLPVFLIVYCLPCLIVVCLIVACPIVTCLLTYLLIM